MKNKLIDTFNHVTGRHGFDYSVISEDVIIGTNMCCQFGFAKELLEKDVLADMSLEDEKVDAPHGVDYFLWLPTVDGDAPSPDKLELGVRTIEFFVKKGIKMYIHCKNGHGRAPTLYIAYLVKSGMDFDAAFSSLKQKRPGIHLTEKQVHALKTYETRIQK